MPARLIDVADPEAPRGAVIVVHGGADRGRGTRVSPAQLSVLRMIPIASRIRRATRGEVLVRRLLNTYRGWDEQQRPVDDIAWAIRETTEQFGPDLPICLVGHSLGGRAALLAAADPRVRGVIALAPWVYPDDVPAGLHDTQVVIIHGDRDRIASPERSARLARALARTTPVSYVCVRGGAHAMLSHQDQYDGLAARCAAWLLIGEGEDEDATVQRIAAGDAWIEV